MGLRCLVYSLECDMFGLQKQHLECQELRRNNWLRYLLTNSLQKNVSSLMTWKMVHTKIYIISWNKARLGEEWFLTFGTIFRDLCLLWTKMGEMEPEADTGAESKYPNVLTKDIGLLQDCHLKNSVSGSRTLVIDMCGGECLVLQNRKASNGCSILSDSETFL